jgi:phospholipase C
VVVSPWSPRGTVAHGLYDHTSVLKMIEWRWHLDPLTIRDSQANNLAEVFDFSRTSLAVPRFVVPTGPFGSLCPLATNSPVASEWEQLSTLAKSFGFNSP